MSTHSVSLRIRKESDLFNPLDPEGMLLADEVKAYLYEKIREKKLGEKVELRIVSDEAVDEARVYEAIHQWCEKELMDIQKEGRRNHLLQLWRFLLGSGKHLDRSESETGDKKEGSGKAEGKRDDHF